MAKSSKSDKRDHIFLVDGSSYIFRAYFAMFRAAQARGKAFTRSDGLPVGAVMNFCSMLWKLLRDGLDGVKPTHIGVVFDASGDTFRNEIYPEYKAHRDEPPADLIPQFPLMREVVKAFSLIPIEAKGYEADDLIATYTREALKAGADVTIIAGDKDLMQLVKPGVVMYDPMPGNERRIGPKEVEEKFGVEPERVVEVQALAGDSSDNIPGVPGIGIKTAAALIQEYGDLETLLKNAKDIKQDKRRESLIQFADQARLSKRLVLLDDKAPVPIPLKDLAMHEIDGKRAVAFLKAMEFTTLTKRVAEGVGVNPDEVEPDPRLKAGGSSISKLLAAPGEAERSKEPPAHQDSPAAPSSKAKSDKAPAGALTPQALAAARAKEAKSTKVDRSKYETVRDLKRLEAWVAKATDQGLVAVDTETTSLDAMQAELVGVSLALSPNEACYIPLGHRTDGDLLSGGGLVPGQIPIRDVLKVLKPMLEDESVLKIGQNLKYDMLVLARHGIEVKPLDDTMLLSYALDAGRHGHGMDTLSKEHLGHDTIKYEEVTGKGKTSVGFDLVEIDKATAYAAEDADVTLRLWRALKPRLVSESMATVYETLERPLVPVLMRMERAGISIDKAILSRLSGEFAQSIARLENEISELAGEGFNPGSAKQLGDILFGKMKLPGGTKTPTGAWSTRANVLEDLAEEGHELPKKILDWRSLTKLKSNYTDALPSYVNPETKRVHTSYALASTPTGRLSSSDPNLQNIPARTEDGRKIRRAFVAEKGSKLVSADYSQIELRLAGRDRRYRDAEESLQGRPRHSRHDGFRNVRRADQGHAARRAPPRQGDQFRHHLRHFRLRAGQPARHPARGSRRLYQEIFRALPRHPRLHGGDQGLRAQARLCGDPVRPQVPLPVDQGQQPLDARLHGARRDQRAAPGHRRRHHPPRHDPHGRRAREGQAIRADAPAGARRAGVRGTQGRGGKDPSGRDQGDGGRTAARHLAFGPDPRRRPRRR